MTTFATDYFVLLFLNTKVPLIHRTKFQPYIPSCFGEKLILLIFLFLVSAAHVYYSEAFQSGHAACEV